MAVAEEIGAQKATPDFNRWVTLSGLGAAWGLSAA
jgi:hypothetical protein